MKITYKEAASLNQILGKLNTKDLSSADYIGTLRLKNKTKKIVDELQGLQSEIHTEFGIEFNFDGSLKVNNNEVEKINQVSSAIDSLLKGEIEIDGTNFMSMESWEVLRKSNNLVLSEDEVLVGWLIKE